MTNNTTGPNERLWCLACKAWAGSKCIYAHLTEMRPYPSAIASEAEDRLAPSADSSVSTQARTTKPKPVSVTRRNQLLGQAMRTIATMAVEQSYDLELYGYLPRAVTARLEPRREVDGEILDRERRRYCILSGSTETIAIQGQTGTIDETFAALAESVRAAMKRYRKAYPIPGSRETASDAI